MTVKKKSSGELEEVKSSLTTNSFRWVLLVLVLSMHPWGRMFLEQWGFKPPRPVTEKQTESVAIPKDVLSMLEKMDSRITEMQNNQSWQIQQEVKRLQWQPFKSEPTPSPNVNR